jgi:hypothetical protein
MDILETANAIALTPDDIAYVADMVEAFVPAREEHRLALLTAALHSHFRGNQQKVGAADGSIPTQFAAFEAAAVHPLIQVGKSLRFEPDSFTLRVLALAQAVKT